MFIQEEGAPVGDTQPEGTEGEAAPQEGGETPEGGEATSE